MNSRLMTWHFETRSALVQKTLGHSTAGMTAHYTHTDQESARQVLAPLEAILNLPVSAKVSAMA